MWAAADGAAGAGAVDTAGFSDPLTDDDGVGTVAGAGAGDGVAAVAAVALLGPQPMV